MKRLKISVLFMSLFFPPLAILAITKYMKADYFIYSSYKAIYLLPVFYRLFIDKKTLKKALFEGFAFNVFKARFMKVLGIGMLFFSVQLLAYLLLKGQLLPGDIVAELGSKVSVNASNIIYIGLYIMVFNSLLEEYFWRGFMFRELRELINPPAAHAATALAFTSYHLVFCYNWFSPVITVVVVAAMLSFTVIMNLVFKKLDLFSCWMIHGFVNAIEIIIALSIFNII